MGNSKIEHQLRFVQTKCKSSNTVIAHTGKPMLLEQSSMCEALTAASGSAKASRTAFDHIHELPSTFNNQGLFAENSGQSVSEIKKFITSISK